MLGWSQPPVVGERALLPSPEELGDKDLARRTARPCPQAGGKGEARARTRSRSAPGEHWGRGHLKPRLLQCRGAPLPTAPRPQRAGVSGDRTPSAGTGGSGGAGRGQWAVRGALHTAAPSACPPCTVSVKLQQLAGHRNLITRPCPFPTPLVPRRLLPGENVEQRRPRAKREKDGEDARRLCGCGTPPPLISPLPGHPVPPPSPLRETAILTPLRLFKILYLFIYLFILRGGAGNQSYLKMAFGETLPVNLDATGSCHPAAGIFPFFLPSHRSPRGVKFPRSGPTSRSPLCPAGLGREAATAQPACGAGAGRGFLGLQGSPGSHQAHPCAFFF